MLSVNRLPWWTASLTQALDIVRVQEQQLTLVHALQASIAQVVRKSPLQLRLCVLKVVCVLPVLHCRALATEPFNTKTRLAKPFARTVCLDTFAHRPPPQSASPNLEKHHTTAQLQVLVKCSALQHYLMVLMVAHKFWFEWQSQQAISAIQLIGRSCSCTHLAITV
jgi:hypothetical protein